MIEALWADTGWNRGVQKGVCHFVHKFQGEWWVAHQRLLTSEKLESMGYHVALFEAS